MTLFIADLSNWQAGISVARVVAEGYQAVICKASEGTGYSDPTFDGFVSAAQSAGAVPGAYHFLRAGDGAAQARVLHARVAAHGGPAGWLVACDNEADAGWDTTRAFFAEWTQLSGGHPLLMYTGAWWWGDRGWPGVSLTPYLWHSRYVAGGGLGSELYGRVPESWWSPGYGGWPTATLLQFSSRARVAGQDIDVSAFRGTLAELRALTGGGAAVTDMTSTREDEAMMLLRGPDGTIVLTDWRVVETPRLSDVDALKGAGVPYAEVSAALVATALALPRPGAAPATAVTLSDAQAAAIGDRIGAALAGRVGLTRAEVAGAVRDALRIAS